VDRGGAHLPCCGKPERRRKGAQVMFMAESKRIFMGNRSDSQQKATEKNISHTQA
jgi:hypothetical protein